MDTKYKINDKVYVAINKHVVALKVAAIVEKDNVIKYNLIRLDSSEIKCEHNRYREDHIYKTRKEAIKYLTKKLKEKVKNALD